jgi:DNA repair protein RadC
VQLFTRKPNGRYRTITTDELLAEAANTRLRMFTANRRPFASPADVGPFLREQLSHLPHEVFVCLYLDTRHRLIEYEMLFRGTVDGATVYPREVVKRALHWNSSAIVLGHNHPSGVAEPSEADRSITLKLAKALSLVEIRLLDHIVVGFESHVSMAERGLI